MKIFLVMMMVSSNALLEKMFKQGDDEHYGDSQGHAKKLKDETDKVPSLLFSLEWVGVARGELRHHVHQGLQKGVN